MSEIVNLRQARKRQARAVAEREAAANRATFGRSKAEKEAQADALLRHARLLDGHKRQRDDEG